MGHSRDILAIANEIEALSVKIATVATGYYLFDQRSDGSLRALSGPYKRSADAWYDYKDYDRQSKEHMLVGQYFDDGTVRRVSVHGDWTGDIIPRRMVDV